MEKSPGVTETERLLADFCERSFLTLWSYSNPYKDDGKELCDLLAVCDDAVFIFFDREKVIDDDVAANAAVVWERWKRRVIDDQVRTAHGSERYLRAGRSVFLDPARTTSFPLPIPALPRVYKIVVAHGAADACSRASTENIAGSLAVAYSDSPREAVPVAPFFVFLDRGSPVHVLDSHNLGIIFAHLDTVADLAAYLDFKGELIATNELLCYCGEEDLLALYFAVQNDVVAPVVERFIERLPKGIVMAEGAWQALTRTSAYENMLAINEVSYGWDELITGACKDFLAGRTFGNAQPFSGPSAILEMAKEPRHVRRFLSENLRHLVSLPPAGGDGIHRRVSLIPMAESGTAYVFLVVGAPSAMREHPNWRHGRKNLLQAACGAAKLKLPHLKKVIGIGVEDPRCAPAGCGNDFALLLCEELSAADRAFYEKQNALYQFFATSGMSARQAILRPLIVPSESGSE